MKNFRTIVYTAFILLGMMLNEGCQSDVLNGPIENNTEKPGMVTNIHVENKSGAALLTYTLPTTPDLHYVKAEYEIRPGVKREAVSTFYTNQLLVDGFHSTEEQEITLYTVNRSEVKSDPIKLKVKPLKSPIQHVYESLQVIPGFGGPNIKFLNENKYPVIIVPLIKDDANQVKSLDKIYTQTLAGNVTLRGLEAVETNFGFVVSDRFGNVTDTLYKKITPYSEEKLDRTKFAEYTLPGDATLAYGTFVRYLWDGNYNGARWPCIFTTEGVTTPQTITIDLGVSKALSRLIYFPRTEDGTNYYRRACLKTYEVWGSNSPPANGSFDNWTLLASNTIVKPSGLPAGQESAEDKAYALKGWSTEFEPGLPPFRYIRIKCLKNWENTFAIMGTQIEVYGSK